jgi:hypothetical protein
MDMACRFGTRAVYVEKIACHGAQNTLSHVTAARVAGAKNENGRSGHLPRAFWKKVMK